MSRCGKCTLCCLVLPVPSINKKAGELCPYCDVEKGCIMYENRPEECKKFNCAFVLVKSASEEFRPDKCNVIFEQLGKHIVFGTMHPDYNDAYWSEVVQKQIESFREQGYSVIISSFTYKEFPIIYPVKGRTINEVFREYKKLMGK